MKNIKDIIFNKYKIEIIITDDYCPIESLTQ